MHSGGLLMATPHYVRAPRREMARGISRNTFAVFMQPDVYEPMDCPPGGCLLTRLVTAVSCEGTAFPLFMHMKAPTVRTGDPIPSSLDEVNKLQIGRAICMVVFVFCGGRDYSTATPRVHDH